MIFPIVNFTNCTGITALKTSEQLNERKNCSNVKTSSTDMSMLLKQISVSIDTQN